MEMLFSAFIVGLAGAGHCVGMCGGIMAALSLGSQRNRFSYLLSYNAGRIASYCLAGALMAWLGSLLAGYHQGLQVLRWLAAALLIAMALYLADIWRGLTYLEKAGGWLWRYLQPLSNKLLPVKTQGQALSLGIVWGWLPCGLIYSALALAAAQGRPEEGALVMLAFGLGTLPSLLVAGVMAQRVKGVLQNLKFRRSMAALVLLTGLWTLWGTLGYGGHSEHGPHGEHQPVETQQSQRSMPPAETELHHHHHE